MLKKILAITAFVLLLTSFKYASQEDEKVELTKMTGTLVEKVEGDNNKFYSIEDENGNPLTFVVTEDTYMLYETEIKIGDTISGYFTTNIPLIAIYPPQYPVDVLIKDNDYFSTKYSIFDENYLSTDEELVINVSYEKSKIVDRNGNEYKESIIDKPIIAIYSITTRSLPPQTSPEKIIVLDGINESSFISDESYEYSDSISKISVKKPIVNLVNGDNEKLINDSINYIVQGMYEEQLKVNEDYKEAYIATGGTEESYIPIEATIDYETFLLNEKFLSIKLFKHQTLANAYNKSLYLNYDIENGQLLTIDDISDREFVKNEIIRMATFRTEEMPTKYNYDVEMLKNISIDYSTKFYIREDEHVVIVFDKYEISSGSDGEQKFIISNPISYTFNGLVEYYPLSKISNILGYKVKWLQDVRSVSLSLDEKTILIPVDEAIIIIDDIEIQMEEKPIIHNNMTYVNYEYILSLLN